MTPELRKEMLRVLKELSNAEVGSGIPLVLNTPVITREAVRLLREVDALSGRGTDHAMITMRGYAYYQELKAPRRYWLSQNWFPVAILLVTSLVTVGSHLMVALLS